VWLFLFNAYFAVDNVVVKGAERIDDYRVYNIIDAQLDKNRWFFFSQKNIFALSKRQLKKEILKHFSVDDLRVNKDLPRTLTVSFAEKTPAAVWLEQERYYYIDGNLNVLAEVEGLQVNAADFTILKNETDRPLIRPSGVGKRVSLGAEYLIASLALAHKAGASGLTIDNIFDINEPEKTLRLHIVAGPAVYFNIENDLDKQFDKLTALMAEMLNPNDLKNTGYIDLRFGDKVYYK